MRPAPAGRGQRRGGRTFPHAKLRGQDPGEGVAGGMPLQPGVTGEVRTRVDSTNVASAVGAGGVDVFGTPYMIALMEAASWQAVQPHLEPGLTTVGTVVEIRHLAATPMGMGVRATSELVEVDGRRLVFRVEAFDEREKIGEGRHERYIVQREKFLQRISQKAGGA